MPFLARILTTLALGLLMNTTVLHAAEVSPKISVGTQEVGPPGAQDGVHLVDIRDVSDGDRRDPRLVAKHRDDRRHPNLPLPGKAPAI